MAFNGSGQFLIDSAGQPPVSGTAITVTAHTALTADLATGLSTAICKDGQTTTTAVIPFAAGISVASITNSTGIASGTYAPTLTNTTNVTASTPYTSSYVRVGNNVTVYFRMDVDPTAAAPTATEIQMTLPIASNLAASTDLHGCAVSDTSGQVASILGDASSNKASIQYSATFSGNAGWRGSFCYQVI